MHFCSFDTFRIIGNGAQILGGRVLLEENLPFREVFAGGWNSGGHPRVLQGAH